MLSWNWLKIGRRIEWVAVAFFLFGVLVFGYPALRSPDLSILFVYGAIVMLTAELPFVVLLRRRRQREALLDPGVPIKSRKKRGRFPFYLLLFGLTLVSATVQLSNRGLVSLAGSMSSVYLWNLGLFVAVVVLNELSLRMKRNRLQKENH